jgi:hypothetical protein
MPKSKVKRGEASNSPSTPQREADHDRELIRRLKWLQEHAEEYRAKLLAAIKERLPQLEELLRNLEDHWGLEDGLYRFYHQSFKVYRLQSITEEIAKTLQGLLPDLPLNRQFQEIVSDGTGHKFELSHNADWTKQTRPIVEACFHSYFLLKMVCKYGRELNQFPDALPSGWALVLYLFDLR